MKEYDCLMQLNFLITETLELITIDEIHRLVVIRFVIVVGVLMNDHDLSFLSRTLSLTSTTFSNACNSQNYQSS